MWIIVLLITVVVIIVFAWCFSNNDYERY